MKILFILLLFIMATIGCNQSKSKFDTYMDSANYYIKINDSLSKENGKKLDSLILVYDSMNKETDKIIKKLNNQK